MELDYKLKGNLSTKYNTKYQVEWFVTKKHAKAKRIARALHSRKADVSLRRSKSYTLVRIHY